MTQMIDAATWSPAPPEDTVPMMEARYIGAVLVSPAVALEWPGLTARHFWVK